MITINELFEAFKDYDGPEVSGGFGKEFSCKGIQAKDVPEDTIIKFLTSIYPLPAFNFSTELDRSIYSIFPEFPKKVVLAKLRSMIKRGKIQGCACGCRGDFTLI